MTASQKRLTTLLLRLTVWAIAIGAFGTAYWLSWVLLYWPSMLFAPKPEHGFMIDPIETVFGCDLLL